MEKSLKFKKNVLIIKSNELDDSEIKMLNSLNVKFFTLQLLKFSFENYNSKLIEIFKTISNFDC